MIRRPRPLATSRAIVRNLIALHRASRDYRALCREGRAPHVSVHIRLETDHGDDWSGMKAHGIYGVKTSGIALNRRGLRYIDRIPRDLRRTCIRELLRMQAEETDQ